jgi:hypothetical protein
MPTTKLTCNAAGTTVATRGLSAVNAHVQANTFAERVPAGTACPPAAQDVSHSVCVLPIPPSLIKLAPICNLLRLASLQRIMAPRGAARTAAITWRHSAPKEVHLIDAIRIARHRAMLTVYGTRADDFCGSCPSVSNSLHACIEPAMSWLALNDARAMIKPAASLCAHASMNAATILQGWSTVLGEQVHT